MDWAATGGVVVVTWNSAFVEINGLNVHYLRGGSGSRTVVLCHGLTDQGLCWKRVADDLAADHDVIMVDSRGHGRTADPENGYGTSSLVRDLAAFILKLELKRPAIVGHSMGGGTVLAISALHPDLIGATIAEDPAAFNIGQVEGEFPRQWRSDFIMRKRLTGPELDQLIREKQPGWHEDDFGPWAESMQRVSFRVMNIFDPADDNPLDWSTIFPAIAVPTLIIGADKDKGAIIGPDEGRTIASANAEIDFAHIAGAGHSVRRDKFDAYMKAMRGFLAETALRGRP